MQTLIKTLPWFFFVLLYSITSPATSADIKAGEKKAAACLGCHGQKGVSNNPQWPNLAGQKPAYLSAQLKAFRDKSRINPTMQGMAASLSDDDIENLAAYFAGQDPGSAGGDAKLTAKGKEKFTLCAGCHGTNGKGNGGFPRLAGQHPDYLARQLKNFQDGSRKGGPMPAMARNLSPEDIDVLAAYLGSLK